MNEYPTKKENESLKKTDGGLKVDIYSHLDATSQTGSEQYSQLSSTVKNLLSASISDNTRKALHSDIRQFFKWVWHQKKIINVLPADEDIIAEYIGYMVDSGKKRSTITRSISTLSKVHIMNGWKNPIKTNLINAILKGLKRSSPMHQKKARALMGTDLIQVLKANMGSSWVEKRNRAMISIGWLGALRCSEIVRLNLSDIEITVDGKIILTIRRSKTDQEGFGKILGFPFSPINEHIISWKRSIFELYGRDGPLFPRIRKLETWFPSKGLKNRLTERGASKVIKRCFVLSRLDPLLYSPHSLRSGFITTAAAAGVPERIIQRHSRHASIATLRGYVDAGTIWEDNPLPAVISSMFGTCKYR